MISDRNFEKINFQYLQNENGLVMKWLGESSMQYPKSILIPYFSELLPSFSGFMSVTVDFQELEYMNSSTLQPILYLLKNLDKLNIPVTICYSGKKKWQELSFNAIKGITDFLKNISIVAK